MDGARKGRLLKWLFVLVILSTILPPAIVIAATIQRIRLGLHPGFTRLVLDIKGSRTSQNIHSYPRFTKVVLTNTDVSTSSKRYDDPNSMVASVTFRKIANKLEVTISHRFPNLRVKRMTLPPESTAEDGYRLILDFYRTHQKKSKESAPDKKEESANGALVPSPHKEADSLFSEADAYYQAHCSDLSHYGTFIIGRYQKAINAAPAHPMVPRALYRCAESAFATKGFVMASNFARCLNATYPHSVYSGPAWILLGKSQINLHQFNEAIIAFKMALKTSLSQDEKLEVNYLLGLSLASVGKHREALDALNRCLGLDPRYYLKRSDILRYIGESYFGIGDYENSTKYLLWFLNLCSKETKSQNIILARLAEGFQHKGELQLAEKIRAYLQAYLPGTEGDIISRIRQAEQLERKGEWGLEQALSIYQELVKSKLSKSLSQLIKFRLAYTYWKLGELQKSLAIVNTVISENPISSTVDEFYDLKADLIVAMIKEAYKRKRYLNVIALYGKNEELLRLTDDSSDIRPILAESYVKLQLFPKALALYKELVEEDPSRKDEWLLKAAGCCLEMNKPDPAISYCQEIRSPLLKQARVNTLAKAFFLKKDYSMAARYYRLLLESYKDVSRVNWETLMNYCSCLLALGRYSVALSYLHGMETHPGARENSNHLQLCLLAGRCYERLGKPLKALSFYKKAVGLIGGPDHRNYVTYKLATLYRQIGKQDEARKMFSELLSSQQALWRAVAQEQLNDLESGRSKS